MMEETTGLDNDWKELQGILVHNMPPAPTKAKDDYDVAVRELIFETKAKPTDRLKTEEELAK